jgi:hypothetical protein
MPDDVARFLARLVLLGGVPFNNLVADARMLPAESIRFFFIDHNWMDALIGGALSIADLDDAHGALVRALRPSALARSRAQARSHRLRLRALRRGEPLPALPLEPAEPYWSGFLLRSAAVSNWPDLTVAAFADGEGKAPLPLLRVEAVSPSILVVIAEGVAARFEIAEPAQDLHFGLQDGAASATWQVALRGLGHGIPVGDPTGDRVDVPMRRDSGDRRVIDVRGLREQLGGALEAAYARHHAQPPALGPAAFALELIVGTQRQPFFHVLGTSHARR